MFFIVCMGAWNGTPRLRLPCGADRSTFQNIQLHQVNQGLTVCVCVGVRRIESVDRLNQFDIIVVFPVNTQGKGGKA